MRWMRGGVDGHTGLVRPMTFLPLRTARQVMRNRPWSSAGIKPGPRVLSSGFVLSVGNRIRIGLDPPVLDCGDANAEHDFSQGDPRRRCWVNDPQSGQQVIRDGLAVG